MTSQNVALFGRRCRLTLAIPDPKNYADSLTNVLLIDGEGDPLKPGLRIGFKINKGLHKEPNTSEIDIYNLSEDSRALLNHKGVKVLLEAGYVNAGVTGLFEGDVRTVDHVRQKADWKTVLRCGDGERSFCFARVSGSFAPGSTAGQVLRAIATATGLRLGNVSAIAAKLDSVTFQQGYTVTGSAHHALDKLLSAVRGDYSYSTQHDTLQIFDPANPSQDLIPYVSPDTGLIGSPQMGSPSKKGKPGLCKFTSLLVPVQPGGVVHLKSDRYDTNLVVRKCEFQGDTHGGDWQTHIEGELMS